MFTHSLNLSQERARTFCGVNSRARIDLLALLQRWLIAVVVFDVPFHCDVNLAYDEFHASLNAIGGLQVSVTSFAMVGLYSIWALQLLLRRSWSPSMSFGKISCWPLIYVGASIASVVYAANRQLAIFEVVLLVQTLLLYIFIIKKCTAARDIAFLVYVIIASLFLQACLILSSFVLGETLVLGPWTVWLEQQRAGGTVGSPNTAGSFIQLTLAPCLCAAISAKKGWLRTVGGVTCLLGLAALLLTFSRGAWLATVVSFVGFLGLMGLRGWLPRKVSVFISICGAVLAVVSCGLVIDRLGSEEAASVGGRWIMVRLASEILHENAVLGVGANNYAVVMEDYIRYPVYAGQWLHTVHNKFLLVWCELGLLGLLGFVGFLGYSLACGYRVWRARDPVLSPIALAFSCGIIGQSVHMQLALFHARPQVQLLWIACAILVGLDNIVRRQGAACLDSARERRVT